MKQIIAMLIVLGIPEVFCLAANAAETEREFEKLTQERDQALSNAVEPIQRRYRAALEILFRKATQANDLGAAVRIKEALEALPSNSPAVAVGQKGEVIGAWSFKNKNDGPTAVDTMKADKGYFRDGKRIGTWDIKEKQLIITYENGWWDRYDLPVRDGKLEGKNPSRNSLTLMRKIE